MSFNNNNNEDNREKKGLLVSFSGNQHNKNNYNSLNNTTSGMMASNVSRPTSISFKNGKNSFSFFLSYLVYFANCIIINLLLLSKVKKKKVN